MSYNIEVIRESQHKTSLWSGGTTTELYIYPKNSLYSQRNFKWRLSSAKVEVEKSKFTSLQGICRHIMVIEGKLFLEHENHHNATLKAFEQDSFSGDWTTTSFGKVTDFNLMIAQGYTGALDSIFLKSGEIKDIWLHSKIRYDEKKSGIIEAFYIVQGNIEIDNGLIQKISLNKGDLALVTRIGKEINSELKIHIQGLEESKIIKATIF
jgi:hypothetical protein